MRLKLLILSILILVAQQSFAQNEYRYQKQVQRKYFGTIGFEGAIPEAGNKVHDGHISMISINGYKYGQFFIGAGTGLKYYFNTGGLVIPWHAHFRANLMKTKFSPFLLVNVGYNTGINVVDTGVLLEPGVGFSFETNSGFAIDLTAAYLIEQVYGTEYEKSLNIKLALRF